MFVSGSCAFEMFYTHVLCELVWPRARINVITITQYVQNFSMDACLHCVDLLCMYYTVCCFPGHTPNFAVLYTESLFFSVVLYTEKLAFQCVTLQS